MGKNKFALKCISGNIKCFKNISFFFCSGNPGRRGPTQPAYRKIPLIYFFLKPPLIKVEFLDHY